MDKKVTLRASRALHKVSSVMKLSLGTSMNQGDYFDTSIITIGLKLRE
jgi:hypothetical protein